MAGLSGLAALLVVCACAPDITSPSVATGEVGRPFNYQIQARHDPTSFSAAVPPPAGLTVASATGLISGTPTEAGTFNVQIAAANSHGQDNRQLTLTVTAGSAPVPGHEVVSEKELFIHAPAVLADSRAALGGAWHFRSALKRIAGVTTDADLETFANAWFDTWSTNTTVPGANDPFATRTWVTAALRSAFAADRIKLIAIVNRLDLTKFPNGDHTKPPLALGEGRFVYEVRAANGVAEPFTLIFEYRLPAQGADLRAELERWAKKWHALGRPALGNAASFPPAYLQELQAITDEYSATGTLNQIRTNEFLTPPQATPPIRQIWELREFHLQATPARLVQVPVALTPDLDHNNSAALAGFINGNQTTILARGVDSIPPNLQGSVSPVPAAAFPPTFQWTAPGVTSPRAAFIVSFNTCSGCHAGDTKTPFQHIGKNAPDKSLFLRGPMTLDHALPDKTSATHDEMEERSTLLAEFALDTPATRGTRFSPARLDAILRARANRPH